MAYFLTVKNGPLDGTYEFPEMGQYMPPGLDAAQVLAWGILSMAAKTKKVGASVTGVAPATLMAMRSGDQHGDRSYTYTVTAWNEENGKVYVTAEYKGLYRPPASEAGHQ